MSQSTAALPAPAAAAAGEAKHPGKSHKTEKRDKIKHSKKLAAKSKKGGGGGKHTWGRPGDELKFQSDGGAIDSADPNFDETEIDVVMEEVIFLPRIESEAKFKASIQSLANFKKAVKTALDEFLTSNDHVEFIQRVREQNVPIWNQEVPYICVKHSLDKKDTERDKTARLLGELHKANICSPAHFQSCFTKLFNEADDLTIDVPNARTMIDHACVKAVEYGYLSAVIATQLSDADKALHADAKQVSATKTKIASIVKEFLVSADIDEAAVALEELKASAFHFEFVKKAISLSFDATDTEREFVSLLLSALTGDTITQDDIAKAFQILLQRVEDLSLDVPQILTLFSKFLARAIVDECLPPSFLVRQDLSIQDLGFQVLQQASELLSGKGASERLQHCWRTKKTAGTVTVPADAALVLKPAPAGAAAPAPAAAAAAAPAAGASSSAPAPAAAKK